MCLKAYKMMRIGVLRVMALLLCSAFCFPQGVCFMNGVLLIRVSVFAVCGRSMLNLHENMD
jgi:hypothetical protein